MSLKPLPYREVKRKLEAAGFRIVGQKGSHVKFAKETPEGLRVAIVPQHKEVAVGTLRSILRQAGLTPEEFEKLQSAGVSVTHATDKSGGW
ncbi:putative RNA binding protein YcfA, dsRBD-like fold, HicA-like mRNA interferase family [Candidatus Fervidibacteria bacterium JGI MDM2 JNZ-1-D12]